MAVFKGIDSNSDLEYPTISPSLDLNFAMMKTLDPKITFTRSSTGTYVGADGLIKTAVANEARFDHDPVTRKCLGLLMEESRSNYHRNTDFSSVQTSSPGPGSYSYWVLSSSIGTLVNDGTLAPNGTSIAYKLVPAPGLVQPDPSSLSYTYDIGIWQDTGYALTSFNSIKSIYFKPAGYTKLAIRVGNYATSKFIAVFDCSNMSVALFGITDSNTYGRIEYSSNGWYRAILSYSSGYYVDTIFPYTTDSTFNGSSGIYIWGMQMELGTFPTSYIPTTTTSVTRAAENLTITGTNFTSWYRQDQGTFIFNAPTLLRTGANNAVMGTTSTPESGIQFWNGSGTGTRLRVYVSGTLNIDRTGSIFEGAKWGLVYNTNDTKLFKNGTEQQLTLSSSPVTIPTSSTSFFINCSDGAKTINRLTYYPTRLPDKYLQLLTQN